MEILRSICTSIPLPPKRRHQDETHLRVGACVSVCLCARSSHNQQQRRYQQDDEDLNDSDDERLTDDEHHELQKLSRSVNADGEEEEVLHIYVGLYSYVINMDVIHIVCDTCMTREYIVADM